MVKRMARAGIKVATVRRVAAFVICAFAWFPTASEAAIGPRPCDIYARGGTPCVAAHSSTRALYARYKGPLYELQRASDYRRLRIVTLTDGYANAAAQDSFCANDACTITRIFDQSPKGNDLTIAGPGGNGGQNRGVVADRLPVWLAGRKVYGMSISSAASATATTAPTGVATGSQPEGDVHGHLGHARQQRAAASTTATPRPATWTPATATWTRSTSARPCWFSPAATAAGPGCRPTWRTGCSVRRRQQHEH